MESRRLFWVVFPVLLCALALETRRAQGLLQASRDLRIVQEVGQRAGSGSPQAAPGLRANLSLLREAARLDRVNVEVPLARGSTYLLLGNADEALASYHEAEALEPRAEVYMNLGHAHRMAGDRAKARLNYDLATKLDLRLMAQVPPEAR